MPLRERMREKLVQAGPPSTSRATQLSPPSGVPLSQYAMWAVVEATKLPEQPGGCVARMSSSAPDGSGGKGAAGTSAGDPTPLGAAHPIANAPWLENATTRVPS